MCACCRTFSELSQPEELLQKCKDLCESLAESLAEEELKVCSLMTVIKPTSCSPVKTLPFIMCTLLQGRTVTIKLKTVGFKVLSRAVSLPRCISSAGDLFKAASELLQMEIKMAAPAPLALRLMGR